MGLVRWVWFGRFGLVVMSWFLVLFDSFFFVVFGSFWVVSDGFW